MSIRSLISLFLGLCITGAFLFLALRRLDILQILEVIRGIDLFPWLPLGMVSYLIGHFIRGLRTRMLVSSVVDLSTAITTQIVVLGYAVNNVLPARLGELARVGMLRDRGGVSLTYSFTITLVERLLDGFAILVLLGLSAVFLNIEGMLIAPVTWIAAGLVSIALGLGIVMLAPDSVMVFASRFAQFVCPKWHDRLLSMVTSMINGLGYLRNPAQLILVFGVSLLVWLFEAGLFWFLFPAFKLTMSYAQAVMTMAITNLGILMPSSPGFIGTFHFFCMEALLLFDTEGAVALGYASVVHLAFFVPITLWGAGIVLWYGIELGALLRMSSRARTLEKVADRGLTSISQAQGVAALPIQPTKFYRNLVAALIPLQDVSADKMDMVKNDVSIFVYGQICSFPQRYVVLLNIGLWIFRIFVFFRTGHRYASLTHESQNRLVSIWAYGKWSVCRQLFRPIRSIALLAFYEHPEVVNMFVTKHNTGSSNG